MSDHIPPIEMLSGSVTLQTLVNLNDPTENSSEKSRGEYQRKQVFDGNGKIKWVRVILSDGTINLDYYRDNEKAKGGKISIWVKRSCNDYSDNPNLVIGTGDDETGDDRKLQVEIDSATHKFVRDLSGCPSRHSKMRWKYSDPDRDTMLWKVRVLNSAGKTLGEVITVIDEDHEKHQEIDRILIWTQ
jgi:hypothetical protein